VKSRFLDLPSLSLRAALGMTNVLRPRGMAIRNALVNKKRDPGRGRVRFFDYKVIISHSNVVLHHLCKNILAMESGR